MATQQGPQRSDSAAVYGYSIAGQTLELEQLISNADVYAIGEAILAAVAQENATLTAAHDAKVRVLHAAFRVDTAANYGTCELRDDRLSGAIFIQHIDDTAAIAVERTVLISLIQEVSQARIDRKSSRRS